MNAKQAVPLAATIAAVAPELFVIGIAGYGIYLALDWLLSEDKDAKPETSPISTEPENPKIPLPLTGNSSFPANSTKIISEKSEIPRISVPKPVPPRPVSAPAAPVPASTVPVVPKIPIPPPSVIPAAKIQPEIPQAARNKIISREEMTKIFSSGRGLTRKSAVSALKTLGYGKTAAYQALEINGRFAPWLQFASDGIITWKN